MLKGTARILGQYLLVGMIICCLTLYISPAKESRTPIKYADDGVDTSPKKTRGEEVQPHTDSPGGALDPEAWQERRKELLSQTSARKLLIFAYMRGGSSIAGEIFNQDPGAVYWYEPLGAFYASHFGLKHASLPSRVLYTVDTQNRMMFEPVEQQWLADYVDRLLSCRYDELPSLTWMHPFLTYSESRAVKSLSECVLAGRDLRTIETCGHLRYVCKDMEDSKQLHCPELIQETIQLVKSVPKTELKGKSTKSLEDKLANFIKQNPQIPRQLLDNTTYFVEYQMCMAKMAVKYQKCRQRAQELCQQSSLSVGKALRLKMEDVEQILQTTPDIHIVHFVRDPRSIALSRTNTDVLMLDDNSHDTMLEIEFLCRRIKEDLRIRHILESKYPGAITQVQYENLVKDPLGTAEQVNQLVGRNSSARWREFVKTFTKTPADLLKWKTKYSSDNLKKIKSICHDVLEELGYLDL